MDLDVERLIWDAARQLHPEMFKVTEKNWANKPRPLTWKEYERGQQRAFQLMEAAMYALEKSGMRLVPDDQKLTPKMRSFLLSVNNNGDMTTEKKFDTIVTLLPPLMTRGRRKRLYGNNISTENYTDKPKG